MPKPTEFYKSQQAKHTITKAKIKKKLFLISSIRLVVFMAICFSIYFFFGEAQPIALSVIIGLIIFLLLVSLYTDLQQKLAIENAIIAINEKELKVAKGDFHEFDEGEEFIDSSHFFSHDIDLFGRGSFFQYINRCALTDGKKSLAKILTANNITDIPKRQDAVKELAEKAVWRQRYSAVASTIKTESSKEQIIDFITNYRRFLPKVMRVLPMLFSTISGLLFLLGYLKIIGFLEILAWLVLGLLITAIYLKKINKLSHSTDKVKDTFRQYSLLLNAIENESFNTSLLTEQQKLIASSNKKASQIFQEFSKALDALDNRNNVFSAIFGNGFFLWDIMQAYKIECWLAEYANKTVNWFEVVAFVDAYNSLANYSFNHPDHVFPAISNNENVIEATQLGHPLLNTSKRIDNDLTILNSQFFIITGANMAGKSTFLRTVSLHIVMANAGLPVCATSSNYAPVKLITSMRTSDSLTDEASYFYSELTRLKFIVSAIEKEAYFIVLDEILKGTNSTDKAIGSRKFVEKLVASKATGIIATHDLSLCETAKNLTQIKNYYFDAAIINDELFFDYTFKPGICKNMNASFLLKKMQII